MAIINSIAFGKARGKIGNVIFQNYGKRVIARQKNEHISKPPSLAQLAVRSKLKGGGLAYKYLADWLGDAVGIMKYGENMCSAFTRITNSRLPEFDYISPIDAADQLTGGVYGIANPFHILEFNLSGALPTIKFNGQGTEFLELTYVRMLSFNVVSGEQISLVYTLTESEFLSGIFICPDSFENLGSVACYVANGNYQLVSEIYFKHN